MDEMYHTLTDVVVLFGAGLLAAWVGRYLRAPAVIGFLLAGVALGPNALHLLERERIEFFAELALVLLLFTIGLELSPAPLLQAGARLAIAAVGQIGLTVVIFATGIAVFTDWGLGAAVLCGIAISLSSTAIVLKQLSDAGETDSPAGGLMTGILLIQDVFVILVMIALPLFAREAGVSSGDVMIKFGVGFAVLVVATVLAQRLLPLLVREIFRRGGQELMTIFAVAMACGGAWLAGLADWSWPLGACVAGLLLAQTDLRHQLFAEISPFRSAFNALFFISIGMLADLHFASRHAGVIVTVVVVILLAKFLITSFASRLGGWAPRIAITAGLGLCTVSEFGYVLAAEAARRHLLTPEIVRQFVTVIVGSMLLGGPLVPLAGRLGLWLSLRLGLTGDGPARAEDGHPRADVIVVGYGVNGRNLSQVLKATAIPCVVIEFGRTLAEAARRDGARVIVGDATRAEILEHAGLRGAKALVVAIADREAARRVVAQARQARSDLYVLARARFIADLNSLYAAGADDVIPEEFETSIEIFAHVLERFHVPRNVIDQQVTLVRAGRYRMLRGLRDDHATRMEWAQALEAAVTETHFLVSGSPAVGRTIREFDLRARTGVTIVAITRNGKPTANPPPDFRFEASDVLVLVGGHNALTKARDLLAAPSGGEED
ncbi:MAG: cation:proton antiporter [Phycisphaerales bacterium]|nr:cation:proton antiporter [Phycisphaerales bacterium]